jgi:hypothetical protein
VSGAADPSACNFEFCVYDALHKDYCYKPEWVDFLVDKLRDAPTFDAIIGKKKAMLKAVAHMAATA